MSGYEQDRIVELIDEMGEKSYFYHLATVKYKGEEYVVLQPVGEVENVNEDEVMILHIAHDNGADVYEGIMDEQILQEVFDHFLIEAQETGEFLDDEEMSGFL